MLTLEDCVGVDVLVRVDEKSIRARNGEVSHVLPVQLFGFSRPSAILWPNECDLAGLPIESLLVWVERASVLEDESILWRQARGVIVPRA